MKIRNIIFLQIIVIIYTFNSIIAKYSAGQQVMSLGWIACLCGEVAVLGVYAVLWQQIIKKFELSVAYANRAMAIIWYAVWALILFHEKLTVNNIIGIVLVLIGTILANTETKSKEAE